MSKLTKSGRKSKLSLPLPVCSIQTLKELDKTYLHWREQTVLLSLVIQILISSGVFLRDTQKCLTKYLQPHDPVRLTHKINQKGSQFL